MKEKIDKLQAFKDYVHQRLDDAGIEKEPNGEHSQHGCRIGDRLDIALSEKPNWISVNDKLPEECTSIIGIDMPFEIMYKEINEKTLSEIGFRFTDFPCMFYNLTEHIHLKLAYAEGKWYGYLVGIEGNMIPIPKDLKSIEDVENLIKALV